MQTRPFCSRLVACLLITTAASIQTTPIEAAPAGGPGPGPTTLHVEVIANGGPTFFGTGFEGLGDVVVSTPNLERGNGGGRGNRGNALTLSGRVRFFRGFTTNRDLWDWRQQALATGASSAKRDVVVVLYDQTFAEVARWELKGAWPVNVTYSLAADGAAQEELELAYSGITRP